MDDHVPLVHVEAVHVRRVRRVVVLGAGGGVVYGRAAAGTLPPSGLEDAVRGVGGVAHPLKRHAAVRLAFEEFGDAEGVWLLKGNDDERSDVDPRAALVEALGVDVR